MLNKIIANFVPHQTTLSDPHVQQNVCMEAKRLIGRVLKESIDLYQDKEKIVTMALDLLSSDRVEMITKLRQHLNVDSGLTIQHVINLNQLFRNLRMAAESRSLQYTCSCCESFLNLMIYNSLSSDQKSQWIQDPENIRQGTFNAKELSIQNSDIGYFAGVGYRSPKALFFHCEFRDTYFAGPPNEVILKVYDQTHKPTSYASDLLRESAILRLLNHPNILPESEVVCLKGYQGMLSMATITPKKHESLENFDQRHIADFATELDHLRKTGEFGPVLRQYCGYMAQVQSALGYLVDQQIVLGDLKPANILLDSYGKVLLMDFEHSLVLPIQVCEDSVGRVAVGVLGGTHFPQNCLEFQCVDLLDSDYTHLDHKAKTSTWLPYIDFWAFLILAMPFLRGRTNEFYVKARHAINEMYKSMALLEPDQPDPSKPITEADKEQALNNRKIIYHILQQKFDEFFDWMQKSLLAYQLSCEQRSSQPTPSAGSTLAVALFKLLRESLLLPQEGTDMRLFRDVDIWHQIAALSETQDQTTRSERAVPPTEVSLKESQEITSQEFPIASTSAAPGAAQTEAEAEEEEEEEESPQEIAGQELPISSVSSDTSAAQAEAAVIPQEDDEGDQAKQSGKRRNPRKIKVVLKRQKVKKS